MIKAQVTFDGGKSWKQVNCTESIPYDTEPDRIKVFTLTAKDGGVLTFEGKWGIFQYTVNIDEPLLKELEVGKQYEMKAPFL